MATFVPGPLRQVLGAVDDGVRGLLSLPAALPALVQQLSDVVVAVQRIARFEDTLTDIARVAPHLEQLAQLGSTLDDIARVAPALEQLAALGRVLEDLIDVLRPVGDLEALAPTLRSLDRSIASLEGTIGDVSLTLLPLQSTTERVGRVVDRLATRRGRGEPEPPTST